MVRSLASRPRNRPCVVPQRHRIGCEPRSVKRSAEVVHHCDVIDVVLPDPISEHFPDRLSAPSCKVTSMERKIWTAAELEEMTPAERREISRSAAVTDLSEVDPAFLERARESARRHMAANEQPSAP